MAAAALVVVAPLAALVVVAPAAVVVVVSSSPHAASIPPRPALRPMAAPASPAIFKNCLRLTGLVAIGSSSDATLLLSSFMVTPLMIRNANDCILSRG